MSSGQSLKNGNSVEPGLPNTFLMPNARNRSSVACLTVMEATVLADFRDNGLTLEFRHCEEQSDEAIHSFFVRSHGLLRFARNDGLVHLTTTRCRPWSARRWRGRSTGGPRT